MEKDFKKVIFILKDLPVGGVEEVFYCLGKEFVEQKVSVDVLLLTRSFDEKNLNRFKKTGVRIIFLDCNPLKIPLKAYHFFKDQLNSFKSIGIISAKEKANVVSLLLKLISNFANRKVNIIVTRHVSIISKISFGDSNWYTKYLYKVYGLANLNIVACSQGLANEISDASNVKCDCIYNPIIGPELKKRAKNIEVTTFFRSDAKVLKIAFVGRLSYQKGLDLLLDALEIVSRPVELVVAGDGDLKTVLTAQAEELKGHHSHLTISFVGVLREPLGLISESDLFVMPSRFEGLPTVLIEAMYINKCLLSSDCDYGPDEIIPRQFSNQLFEVGDVSTLAKKIDSFTAYEFPEEVKQGLQNKFSQEVCATSYHSMLFDNQ